jgi:hypothetical protein
MAVEEFQHRYLSLTGRQWDSTERDTNHLALSTVLFTENVNKDLEMIRPTKRIAIKALASDVRSKKKSKVSNSLENTDSTVQEISGATTPEKNDWLNQKNRM